MSEHVLCIENDFLDDAWRAVCSCGWDGPDRATRDEVHDDWANHCDVEFMDATMQGPQP